LSLEAGTWVGRFRISRLIAQGGMAEVYRAEQELAGGIFRPVALKVIRPEYSESTDFREMFLDEARLACTLSHPNIAHIYEVGESDGRLYMAMELVPGESLAFVARQLRDKGERFADEALIAIGIFSCSALEMVHGLRLPGEGHINLVHRDVSPHNLLLGPNGSLKLIDFGIAKAASNRNLTSPGVTKGKAGYFSPEQAMGRALDGRSDLFSLGVTLYKLASGGTPFDEHRTHHERNTALVHGRWLSLREVCEGLPEGFYAVVDQALQVRPADRFPDAQQMRLALERLALSEGFHVGPSTLAGYLEHQDDDPLALGARPSPSSARLERPAGIAALAAAARAEVTAAGRTAASHRHLAHAPGLSSPNNPRRTERMAARAASNPSLARVEQTRRRLFLVSGGAVAVLAIVAGLVIGERAARRTQPDLVVEPPVPVVTRPVPPAPEPAAVEPPAPRETQEPSPPPEARPAPAPVVARRDAKPPSPKAEAVAAPASVIGAQAPKGNGRLRVGGADDAEVLVNGERQGVSPLDLQMPAGVHSVVVRSMDGTRQLSERVEVRADRTSRIIFDFDRSLIQVGN
jgi:serine/threonine protein kinase